MYSDKKNFLIVTASIGSGHMRAAEAIASEIRIKYQHSEVHIVDFMSTKTAYLNGFLKEAYLKMLNLVPDMYEFLYSFSSGRMPGFSIQSMLALAMKNDMANLIKKNQADVVIYTHPFPCAAGAYLKRTNQTDAVIGAVITDFAIHQLWVYKEVEFYFVANDKLKQILAERGIDEWRIYSTGIPIERSFNREYDCAALAERFGLNLSKPVVLIMGGGLGMGGVKQALVSLERLTMELQVMVVTGENQELWLQLNKFAETAHHQIMVLGFTNNIQELMAVSTLLITKPGALTISEALAMRLPMILNEPIPGQEEENAAYLEQTGAAVWVKDMKHLAERVAEILDRPQQLEVMRQCAEKYKRPDAAIDIVEQMEAYFQKQENEQIVG